tara:strand:+ start:635 stop:1381 length:747 start_codon:yes stop_codon:yes gene_type:complete
MLAWIMEVLVSSGITVAVISMFGFVFQNGIIGYFSRRLDERVANRTAEFESKLRINENELSELQRRTNSLKEARNKHLNQRKVEALEYLWNELCFHHTSSMSAEFLKVFKIGEVNKSLGGGSSDQDKLSLFAKEMSQLAGIDKLAERRKDREHMPNWVKLYVSDGIWDAFTAHSAIISHAVATFLAWQNGLSAETFLKNDSVVEIAEKALPHQKEFLPKYGIGGCYFLLDELRNLAFSRIREGLVEAE